MTENALSPEERLKQLRSRNSTPAAKSKKSHAALGSRIATVGLGASAMLALVTAIDVANQPEAAATPVAAPTADRPVVVVVHEQPTSTPAIKSATNAPIQLTATPVVTTIYTTGQGGQASVPATTQTRAVPTAAVPSSPAPTVSAPAPAPAPVVVAPPAPAPVPAPVAQTNGS